jgi:hypothetical protein
VVIVVVHFSFRLQLVSDRQQWDYPNSWAPMNHMIIEALGRLGHPASALTLASRWIASNWLGYNRTGYLNGMVVYIQTYIYYILSPLLMDKLEGCHFFSFEII